MVTSRIPAYSLNSEFNREFRSFRVTRATPRSTLYAPAIVPIHEYPRVSVHERREALKAALAKAWSSKSSDKKKHDTWAVTTEQNRTPITAADFTLKSHYKNGVNGEEISRVAQVKHELENKGMDRSDVLDKRQDVSQTASFTYCRVANGAGIDIQETLKKGCEQGLHNDLSYNDYLNNVPKCKNSFESNFLKQSHDERYSKRNGYDAMTKRGERDINLNNVEYSSLNGDTYDSLKYSRIANGTESVQYRSYGKTDTVKSKLLNTDSPKSVTSCNGEKLNGYNGVERRSGAEQQRPLTSGPKSLVEQRLAERLEVKVAELPALYLGVDSWTPKSAAFQKSMREHEWSVSSEHSWRRRNERSKRSHHRRSPTSHRRRRHHRDESSPRSPPEQSVAKLSRPPGASPARPEFVVRAPGVGRQARAMAAPPPRPPPNNLLFCGPPPTLPHVVLLPSDAACNIDSNNVSSGFPLNNDNALQEINNVGVPTYDELFRGQYTNSELVGPFISTYSQLPSDNSCLRRTHSFDITDIYNARLQNDINAQAFRDRRSEPDLSKFGLFVEAEQTLECGPHQPPALVLNNPFYDGSYAMDPAQLNQTMVMLPENYLAFEDSFVPWKIKPEFYIERDLNPELYYDGVPLIPSNDPWSTYGNENAGFEYYSPQFVAPITGNEGITYMPLADFEYAIPQYMSLPSIEQANIETFTDNSHSEETITPNIVDSCGNHVDEESLDDEKAPTTEAVPLLVSSNVGSEDEKNSNFEVSNARESSTQSEESFNADISNDVTSSLAFIPSSKSSQVPGDVDDTSDDTSPCSTDYHEASALDLVQSLDELSCCDSTDYSQSRDDGSPIFPELSQPNIVVTSEVSSKERHGNEGLNVLESNKTLANVPLNNLPSIPINDLVSPKQSTVSVVLSSKEQSEEKVTTNTDLLVDPCEVPIPQEAATNSTQQNNIIDQLKEAISDVSANNVSKIPPPPHPPAVPQSWLSPRLPYDENAVLNHASFSQTTPKIHIKDVEQTSDYQNSRQPVQDTQSVAEPQPSCSFVPPMPCPTIQQTSQLKPKEVEVCVYMLPK